MGVFEQFPYTNFHEMNAGWLVDKIREFDEFIHGNIAEEIQQILAQYFADISYDEDTKTITLKLEETP